MVEIDQEWSQRASRIVTTSFLSKKKNFSFFEKYVFDFLKIYILVNIFDIHFFTAKDFGRPGPAGSF